MELTNIEEWLNHQINKPYLYNNEIWKLKDFVDNTFIFVKLGIGKFDPCYIHLPFGDKELKKFIELYAQSECVYLSEGV